MSGRGLEGWGTSGGERDLRNAPSGSASLEVVSDILLCGLWIDTAVIPSNGIYSGGGEQLLLMKHLKFLC